jgi:hypothetical protein
MNTFLGQSYPWRAAFHQNLSNSINSLLLTINTLFIRFRQGKAYVYYFIKGKSHNSQMAFSFWSIICIADKLTNEFKDHEPKSV